jgi:flagellar biosynthesis/type III secretory pathway chaperone
MQRDAKPFLDLIELLEEELSIYSRMRELLDRESHALLHMAASELGEICSAKETLALRVKALDESRKILGERLGRQFAIAPGQLTVSSLCQFAPPEVAPRLGSVRDRLREEALACKQLNDLNSRAARKGIELVSGAVDFLVKNSDPAGKVYEAKKTPYGTQKRAPMVVSREA